MKRKMTDLSHEEIVRFTNLLINGFNDSEFLADRFNLEASDVNELINAIDEVNENNENVEENRHNETNKILH